MFYFLLMVAVFHLFFVPGSGVTRGRVDLVDGRKQWQLKESLY